MNNIAQLMRQKMCFSFEVFPPKMDQPLEPLQETLEHLYAFRPDFISCTYGAGGTNAGRNMEICKQIADRRLSVPVAHITCIGSSKQAIQKQLDSLIEIGVSHILVLRGDLPVGWQSTLGDFSHANELIEFVRAEYGNRFCIAMGAAPEKHIEASTFEEDIANLLRKQDAGAEFIMTQLCYDIEAFQRWFEWIRAAGITLPVTAGIMPVLNKEAVIRMTLGTNGCSVPRPLAEIISRHYNDGDGFRIAGKAYTAQLISSYKDTGVNGLHIYTLNKYRDVSDILISAGY